MQSFSSGIRTRLTTKPGRVVAADRRLADPLRRTRSAVSNGSSAVSSARTISTSGISGAGLKKCMPTTRSGPRRGGRDLGDGERRGVRREHRVGPADPVELGEELALRRELLDDRLDHEVAVGEVAQLGREREPPDRLVARRLLELALLDLPRQEVADPAARLLAQLERHLAADACRRRPRRRAARSRRPWRPVRSPRPCAPPRRAILQASVRQQLCELRVDVCRVSPGGLRGTRRLDLQAGLARPLAVRACCQRIGDSVA